MKMSEAKLCAEAEDEVDLDDVFAGDEEEEDEVRSLLPVCERALLLLWLGGQDLDAFLCGLCICSSPVFLSACT